MLSLFPALLGKLSPSLLRFLGGVLFGALLAGLLLHSCNESKLRRSQAKYQQLKYRHKTEVDGLKNQHKRELDRSNKQWSAKMARSEKRWSRRLALANAEIPQADTTYHKKVESLTPVTRPEKPLQTHLAMEADTQARQKAEKSTILLGFQKKKSYGAISFINPKGIAAVSYFPAALFEAGFTVDSAGVQVDSAALRQVKRARTWRGVKKFGTGVATGVLITTGYLIIKEAIKNEDN